MRCEKCGCSLFSCQCPDGPVNVVVAETYDFETIQDAEEWAHRESLVFDTDEECQEECERLLKTVRVRGRD